MNPASAAWPHHATRRKPLISDGLSLTDTVDPTPDAPDALPTAAETERPDETDHVVPLEVEADPDEVLGGGEWQPELSLLLDQDGTASLQATERHSAHNGTLFSVWHGRDREWTHRLAVGARAVPDPDQIADMALRLRPLLDRVHLGRSVEWDGSNLIGVLDDDAREAAEEIRDIMDEDWIDPTVSVWDAGEWLWPVRDAELTAETTDEEIPALAADLIEQARQDGVLLDGDVDGILVGWRDELVEERGEDEDEDEDGSD